MTQAFNLSQLANNLNTSGQLDATDGLTGATPVANGGTGLSTITANNVILGNGTSAVQVVAPSTSGNVLTSNGTTWVSSTVPPSGVESFNGNTGALNGWQNIASNTFSSSTTINITGIPSGYRAIQLIFKFTIASGSIVAGFRYSTNNGSTYISTNTYQQVYFGAQGTSIEANSSASQSYATVAGFFNEISQFSRQDVNLLFSQGNATRTAGGVVNTSALNLGAPSNTGITSCFNLGTATYINAFQIVRIAGTGTMTGTYTVLGTK